MSKQVNVERSHGGSVLAVTLARPAQRNAITVAMYAALADAIEDAGTDDRIRLITIAGEGRDFTAGNDLADFLQAMPSPGSGDIPVWRLLRALARNQKPLIASVQGNAVGIGTTLLLHCDFVLAEDGCRMVMPFVDLGLVPEAASSLLLPQMAGRRAAARALLLGESFGAREALEMGIASHVIPAGELTAARDALVSALLAKPAQALQMTQALLRRTDVDAVLARMELENGHFAERLGSEEVKAAIAQFFAARAKA
jgi:enoyl-CoA hydratase/carnithine racemase